MGSSEPLSANRGYGECRAVEMYSGDGFVKLDELSEREIMREE